MNPEYLNTSGIQEFVTMIMGIGVVMILALLVALTLEFFNRKKKD